MPFFILEIFDLRHKGAYAVCDKPMVDEELSLSVSSILALTRLSFLPVLIISGHSNVTVRRTHKYTLHLWFVKMSSTCRM